MKAAYIEKTGSVDQITYGDLPKPKPTGAQVVVQVKAVSVNPIDTYIRSGAVAMELPKPFILGCDLAGVVESVGPEVKRLKAGDRVWGSNQGLLGRQGTFAQFAAVEEQWLYPIPEELSFEDAAAIALVGITAHLGLFRDAQLKMGERVFVHGGSGGVGSCVVQMARAVGARVMTTAGNDDKVQICRKLGANVVVNYRTGNVDDALGRFGKIDVWWEILREANLERAISHLALRGRIIVMAGRDAKPVLPIGPFYTRDARLYGFAMFNAPAEEQRKAAAEINRWLARGKLRPQIDRVMKLSETAEAHKLQETSTSQKKNTLAGKIVLVP
ncbi:MAG: NADPH:quinone reductase [Thermoguttaceae bacterium]|jgi:NADPH2:quinone reductase